MRQLNGTAARHASARTSVLWATMAILAVAAIALMARGPHPDTAAAQIAGPGCDRAPVGALEPARPTWCSARTTGSPTFFSGTNSWTDDFNHGLSNADIGPGYVATEATLPGNDNPSYKAQHFRHNNHWMVDVTAGAGFGYTFLRPDRPFTFQNGTLVVEMDAASGIQEYIDSIWPEIVIATAPAPTRSIDDLYAYGQFGGAHAFGCRLDPERYAICDLKNDKPNTAQDDHASQTYQLSRSKCPTGATCSGGYGAAQAAWRSCAGTDPDLNCRDRFRLELTRTTFRLYVNGVLNLQATGLPPLPDAMMGGLVYVYAAGTKNPGITSDVVRFHWDRFAVNSSATG